MTNYEMIVLDLDGTLTNRDKVITPRTKQALMSAQEQGKIVVLASGRPTAGVEPLAKELELERFGSYILSYNGGMITNCRTGEVVFASQIPLAANERIIGLAEEHRVDILTYEETQIITNNDQCPYAVMESNINHLPLVQVESMKDYVRFEVPKFLMLDDGDYLVTVEPLVKAALGKNFSVYRSEPYFLEVMPKGIASAGGAGDDEGSDDRLRRRLQRPDHGSVRRTGRCHGECGSAPAQSRGLYHAVQQ